MNCGEFWRKKFTWKVYFLANTPLNLAKLLQKLIVFNYLVQYCTKFDEDGESGQICLTVIHARIRRNVSAEKFIAFIWQLKRANIIHRRRKNDGAIEKELPAAQVEVQIQVGLWSDPVERTPVCSQTEITGSGRKFERATVWMMVWRWSDQRSIWSKKSDHRRIRAHLSLIRGNFERNWVW